MRLISLGVDGDTVITGSTSRLNEKISSISHLVPLSRSHFSSERAGLGVVMHQIAQSFSSQT